MLEGLLIFPDLLANGLPDSRKSGKNNAFSPQSKRLTRSATEKSTSPRRIPLRKNQLALDAFRYGKINSPLTHSATEKSTDLVRRVPYRSEPTVVVPAESFNLTFNEALSS